ncbi:MAG: hypothetical protein GXN93_04610 [Candidatus Diapherotrites archaeon]|nr:hypothetical protein [Candidatus Diapherotrites archaeon]
MDDRIQRYRKYLIITALIYSAILVSVGILVGWAADHARIGAAEDLYHQTVLQMDSYLVEEQFMNATGSEDCNLLGTRLDEIGQTLAEFGHKLSIYEARHLTNNPEYYYLKPYYFLTEIKAYLLMRRLKADCNTDYTLILFFYRQNDPASREQGYILDDIVRKHPDVHVFSFDINFPVDVGAVDLLKQYYDVNTAPVVIVNDRNKFVGLTPAWKILAAIRQG